MHSEYTDPDTRTNFLPLLTGLIIGLATGAALGILVGVKIALGAG